MKKSITFVLILAVGVFSPVSANAEWKTYEGLYYNGFEASGFYECGKRTNWWLEETAQARVELIEFYKKLKEESEADSSKLSELPDNAKYVADRLFVKIDGFVHPKGEYGHLGRAKRRVTVRKFYMIRVATEADLKKCNVTN